MPPRVSGTAGERALAWFQRGTKAARNHAERAMVARRVLECVD